MGSNRSECVSRTVHNDVVDTDGDGVTEQGSRASLRYCATCYDQVAILSFQYGLVGYLEWCRCRYLKGIGGGRSHGVSRTIHYHIIRISRDDMPEQARRASRSYPTPCYNQATIRGFQYGIVIYRKWY